METGTVSVEPSAGESGRRIKLAAHEALVAAIIIVALGLFIFGPFLVIAAFNRFPSLALAEKLATTQLPDELRIGDWRKVKNVSVLYSREGSPEDIRRVNAEVRVLVGSAKELFLPDNFQARAKSRHDDERDFKEAIIVAHRLSIKAPSLTEPILFKPEEKGDESFTYSVKFERANKMLPGPSLSEILYAWEYALSSDQAWSHDSLPRVPGFLANPQKISTREQLPPGAVVFGEPAAEQAISAFIEKRQRFITQVAEVAESGNLDRFNSSVRTMVERMVAEKFTPASAFSLSSVKLADLANPQDEVFDRKATVEIAVNEDIFALADFGSEPARFAGYDHAEFEKSEAAMAEFFPDVDIGGIPRIVRQVAREGEKLKYTLTVRVRREGPLWEVASIAWQDDYISGNLVHGRAFPIGTLGGKTILIDSRTVATDAQVKQQIEARKLFASQVTRELTLMEQRWGSDREAWKVMQRAIRVHGGQAALDGFKGCKKEWQTTESENYRDETSQLTEWFVYPNLFKATSVTNGRRSEYFFSGGNAWGQTASNKMQPVSQEALVNVNAQIFANHALLYLGRKDGERVTLKYKGRTSASTFAVEVMTNRCPGLELFFEESSGMLVRGTYTVPVRGHPTACVVDYYFTPGQFFPKKAEESLGKKRYVSVMNSVVEIDPAILRGYATATAPSGLPTDLWRFRDSTGNVHTPRDYIGRRVVVFYCGSDLLDDSSYMRGPIRNAAKLVGRIPAKYKSLGVSVLWIEDSVKYDAQRIGRVAAALGLNVPVVIKDESYLWPYKISGQPWAVLFDAGGQMLRTFSGAREIEELDSVLRSLR